MRQLSVVSVLKYKEVRDVDTREKMFEEEVEAKYKCAICVFILESPVQTQCGHLFCRRCIITSIR